MKSFLALILLLQVKLALFQTASCGHQTNACKHCPNNFTKIYGQCYYFSDYATDSWAAALKKCESLEPRSTLLTLETQEEWNILQDFISTHTRLAGNYWWMGGSDTNHEGLFTWEKDQQPFAFNEWCPGQPDNADGNENCVHFTPKSWSKTGRLCWNDLKCDTNRFNIIPHFICEPEHH